MREDQRLLALGRAGHRFAACDTIDQLTPVAAELALEVLDASSASIAQIEHDHGLLRVLHNVGLLADWEEPQPSDETYEVADFPLLAVTVENARPWIGNVGDASPGAAHTELLHRMGMVSSVSIPIVVGSTLWGEIGAARNEERPLFGPGDVAAGEAFCGLLSAALTRIVERDRLHALAFHDALTGLGNRRAIDDRLEEVFREAELVQPVAVVLCDVDGLKQINDAFGHDSGDRVLREVATHLTRVAGSYPGSLAVRLGGDEFCLLLENVSEAEVQAASDQLAAAAAALPLGAGLSCGWTRATTRPGDAPTASAAARAMLRLADAAQYRTKRAGRVPPVGAAAREANDVAFTRLHTVERALEALQVAGPDVQTRLAAVAAVVASQGRAAAWAVSRSQSGGAVEIMVNDDAAGLGRREGNPIGPGVAYDLDDYPETRRALAGGTFRASVALGEDDAGDEAERAFLAAHGYDEVIAAGAEQDDQTAWIIEIVGDASTPPLGHLMPLLRALIVVAIEGRTLAATTGTSASGEDS